MKILLVSPDETLRNQVYQDLCRHRFVVDVVTDGEEAWALMQGFRYDLVLLEAVLPNQDGLSLCRRLRDVGNPVLILLMIESSGAVTCSEGLNHGADACLAKPIRESELLAHLCALSRRGVHRASPVLSWGPLLLDLTAQQVTCQGQALKVNRKEYQFLELLLSYPRQMFSCHEISSRLWSLSKEIPTEATIKSHIRSIRRKLEQTGVDDLIQTHYGQGYRLNPVYDPVSQLSAGEVPWSQRMVNNVTASIWQELMTANARLHQEIEQRKQVENKLQRSEAMLRNAQRVAQIGCWEFDIQTQEIYWTDELFLIHGLSPDRAAPSSEEILTLIHPDDRHLHEEFIRVPALQGKAFEVNLRIIRANDGAVRYINARGGPLLDSSGNLIKLIGTTFDVTRWLR
jgi:PAS domain S-box-containing protein